MKLIYLPKIVCQSKIFSFSKLHSLVKPDYSVLEDDYHGVIVTCLKSYFRNQNTGNWLLIGLGGGVLTMKLLRAFPKVCSIILIKFCK